MKSRRALLFVVAIATLGWACGGQEEAGPAATPEQSATPLDSPTSGRQTTTSADATEIAPKRAFFTRGPQLWSVDPDGTHPILLTEQTAASGSNWLVGNSYPAQSPLGDRVAFVSADGNLWVIDSDGSDLRRLSDEAHAEDDNYYSSHALISGWSPDGTKILYYVDAVASSEDPAINKKQREERGFFVVATGSGDKSGLPELPNFVAWATDSEMIIYEQQYDLGSSRDWYTLEVGTRKANKLTLERLECASVHPSFAASSGQLVYACGSSNIAESSIVLTSPDNTDRQVLRNGKWAEFQFPIFSPADDILVYQHQSDVLAGGQVIFDLQLLDLATRESTQLASGCVRAKSWIDGDNLLFLNDEDKSCSGTATLYKVDVGTGALTTLAEGVDWN